MKPLQKVRERANFISIPKSIITTTTALPRTRKIIPPLTKEVTGGRITDIIEKITIMGKREKKGRTMRTSTTTWTIIEIVDVKLDAPMTIITIIIMRKVMSNHHLGNVLGPGRPQIIETSIRGGNQHLEDPYHSIIAKTRKEVTRR